LKPQKRIDRSRLAGADCRAIR